MPDVTNTDQINEACEVDHQNDNVIDSEQVYQIEKILKTPKHRRQTQYLVKWLGYPSEQNSWVSERDMVAPTDQVQ